MAVMAVEEMMALESSNGSVVHDNDCVAVCNSVDVTVWQCVVV